jgi:hypothetical protein
MGFRCRLMLISRRPAEADVPCNDVLPFLGRFKRKDVYLHLSATVGAGQRFPEAMSQDDRGSFPQAVPAVVAFPSAAFRS